MIVEKPVMGYVRAHII